ncbi:hypothetical protein [Microscilla marina]|uniref:YcxB-like protein domain-containing protein n=1 Tax=Microscilla marina ATCC 23134 TaxID=313606 RepID=A1ZPZ5_MICM2|nr:hypothetical protein [Microscilla marina]EAY27650.1 hypothetical protein M23134_02897 [Microscilla marina ATCC 23134]
MDIKTDKRREQIANACWQQWLDAGYNEQPKEWGSYQQREVFWKEYEALINEAKISLGQFKISPATVARPPLKSPISASPPVKLSFKGDFSYSLQLPKPLRSDVLKNFTDTFANENAAWFFWGLLIYAIGVSIMGGNIANMSNFIWYLLGWGAVAGTKYGIKYNEVEAMYQVSPDKLGKKSLFGGYTLKNEEIQKVEMIDGNLVVYISNIDGDGLSSAMFIPADIEHRDELEQYLLALVAKNHRLATQKKQNKLIKTRAKNASSKKAKKQRKQKMQMHTLANPHFKTQQQHRKGLQKHHQRMHRRK